jgi:hypothetical protein
MIVLSSEEDRSRCVSHTDLETVACRREDVEMHTYLTIEDYRKLEISSTFDIIFSQLISWSLQSSESTNSP